MPTLKSGFSLQEAQLLMTFSELCYVDEAPKQGETIPQQEQRMRTSINAGLHDNAPGWQVAWGPRLSSDRGNMLYVAGNTGSNTYAVSIRGTDWSFLLNWIEDFAALLALVPYPKKNAGNIAAGTLLGLQVLLDLGVLPFVNEKLASGANIYVTGHSLGGCLASALAPMIADQSGAQGRVKVYTFAAPTPGDRAYQSYFTRLFGTDAMAYRVYSNLDSVPDAWANLSTIETYFQGFVACPDDIKFIVDLAIDRVGTEYVTVGTDHELTSKIIWPFQEDRVEAKIDPVGDFLFLWEVGQQHAGLHYLSLLGAKPMMASLARVRGLATTLRKGLHTTA